MNKPWRRPPDPAIGRNLNLPVEFGVGLEDGQGSFVVLIVASILRIMMMMMMMMVMMMMMMMMMH